MRRMALIINLRVPATYALVFGAAHEVGCISSLGCTPSFGELDSRIDMENNMAGIQIGIRLSKERVKEPVAHLTYIDAMTANGGCLQGICLNLTTRMNPLRPPSTG